MERSRCDYSQPRYDRPLTAAITQTCKPETSACFKETSACFKETSACFKETSPCYKEVSPCFKETSACFKETSPCYKEVSPCFKEISPCFKETSPCYKEVSPCFKETSPCFKETSPCIQSDFVFAHHPRTLAFGRKVRQNHFGMITYRNQRCRPAHATVICRRESVPIIQRVCIRPCPPSCFDLRKTEKIITRDSYRYEHQKGFKSPTTQG
ncbi:unnamed protein product [Rotaria sordida]|uniref:Uncharacterized protein n=1 Tax=Rotaria sordida TaxID=392033 RepID=A0A814DGZ0_9BILA|nr:unnamed protein product [Rotaria sordida]